MYLKLYTSAAPTAPLAIGEQAQDAQSKPGGVEHAFQPSTCEGRVRPAWSTEGAQASLVY